VVGCAVSSDCSTVKRTPSTSMVILSGGSGRRPIPEPVAWQLGDAPQGDFMSCLGTAPPPDILCCGRFSRLRSFRMRLLRSSAVSRTSSLLSLLYVSCFWARGALLLILLLLLFRLGVFDMFVAFDEPLFKYSSTTPFHRLFERDKDNLAEGGQISEAPLKKSLLIAASEVRLNSIHVTFVRRDFFLFTYSYKYTYFFLLVLEMGSWVRSVDSFPL